MVIKEDKDRVSHPLDPTFRRTPPCYALPMNGPTILVREGSTGAWSEPKTSNYTDEAHLQAIIAEDPTRLPGIPAGSRAVRELQTSAGPIDVCIVSPSGAITVVECKLQKTSEHHRKIIGQVIDYASALRSDGFTAFRNAWQARKGEDLDQIIDEGDLGALDKNIAEGTIHLCLAVDQIDDDLRRLVEYLYLISNDTISVTALQLTYAQHGDLEILIPSTYGTEIAHAKATSHAAASEKWTWESFLAALPDLNDRELANNLKSRLEEIQPTGNYPKLWFGAKPKGGIFFHIHGERYAPFQLWINAANQLVLTANWSWWSSIKNDVRFAELASFLQQNHLGSTRRVLVSSIDIEGFWKVAVACDKRINDPNPS